MRYPSVTDILAKSGLMLYQIEEKSAGKVLGLSHELGSFLRFGHEQGATPGGAKQIYRGSTAVSIPIDMVAEAFASITPVLKEGEEFTLEHEVLDLLANPSPFYTRQLFLETLAKDYLITSESHVVAIGNINRPPLELQPLGPENLSVNEGQDGLARQWVASGNTLAGTYVLQVQKKMSRYIRDSLTELETIRGYSSKNNSLLRGESKLVSASAEARQHIKGNAHNISILDNGGRLSLHFHIDGDLNPDDFEDWKTKVRSDYGGTSGEHIAATSGPKATITEFGKTNKDMDFAELQKMAKTACALVYKVPLPLITVDAATLNNYKEARAALYVEAVLPLADRIFAGLSNLLLPRYGLDPSKVKITYNRQTIPALSHLILEEVKLRKDIGAESDNELRSLYNREPYEGGDIMYKPANLIPVGSDLFTDDNPSDTLARDKDDGDD